MSKYVISGYYGFGNAGDEAILEAIIRSLQEQDEQAEITVLSAQPERTTAEHGVRAVHRTRLGQIVPALRRADLFISGGGGLLQDATSSRSLLYYLGLLRLARLLGCKTMVYANSIGPIRRQRNQRLTANILKKTDYITVRDQLSLQLLADLGVQGPPMKLTADPVLLLPTPVIEPKPQTLVIAVREWPSEHDFLEQVKLAGRRWVQDGFSLRFIPFHYSRDLAISQQLAAEIGPGASCLSQPQGFNDLLGELAQAEVVVAMRLHALIMAAACNRPLVGIAYDPKIIGFLQSVDQPLAGTTDNLQAQQLYEQVLAVYRQRDKLKQHLADQLVLLQKLAANNARIARALAKGEEI
ncbi:MAG: polysaccharide pyruvyl transferase CsaB [Firmicutes bacterium]|nr:polysaccharide pyruvyl transferase CsaB [Bacillota bacterium]